MKEISFVFSIKGNTKSQKISLCGHLEALVGNYSLSQAGNPEAAWYGIHYDASINVDQDCVEPTDENLIGYVYRDDRVAFVLNPFLDQFITDTKGYPICYLGVNSLDDDSLECRNAMNYSSSILPARWIDDDFLNDDQLPFDFESFEYIDEGLPYLNPKHFSVSHFVKYCRLDKE